MSPISKAIILAIIITVLSYIIISVYMISIDTKTNAYCSIGLGALAGGIGYMFLRSCDVKENNEIVKDTKEIQGGGTEVASDDELPDDFY